jgi:transposase
MKTVRFVGLDVHADSIAIAVAHRAGNPEVVATIPHDIPKLLNRLKQLGPMKCCYEAGPTGFALQRVLVKAGIDCTVVAPSLVPAGSGERIKTDRRDAVKLARFLRSGDLTPIHVPDADTEAMRDLERARVDAVKAEHTARLHLSSFLLRHGRRYPGKRAWTLAYLQWVKAQQFDHEAQRRVLADYVETILSLRDRIARFNDSISELVESWSLKPVVQALQAMRGISTISAVTLAAEIGDFRRFGSATEFMSYTGLVPSERSSGDSRRQGRITKCGNTHVRRILVEAAWAYRFRPGRSEELCRRSRGVSARVQRIAWKAQERLCGKYRRFVGRGKERNKSIVAVARELAGFVWAIANEHQLLAAAQ